jgi:hypothetical protein
MSTRALYTTRPITTRITDGEGIESYSGMRTDAEPYHHYSTKERAVG